MAIELLRSIFNWANVKPNPCDGVKTGSSGTRETILEDADPILDFLQRWTNGD